MVTGYGITTWNPGVTEYFNLKLAIWKNSPVFPLGQDGVFVF